MTLSTAERQRRHRERLKNKGLVRVQGWTTPERAEIINALIEGAALESVLPQPAAPAPPKAGAGTTRRRTAAAKKPTAKPRKRKTKAEKADEEFEKARSAAVDDNRGEIEDLARQGKKPSEIAAHITQKTGVKVSGGHLNYVFGSYPWWTAGKRYR